MKNKLKNILLIALITTISTVNMFALGIKESNNFEITKNETLNHSISFVDDEGVSINLDKPCERIIALYSAHVENIYYLGAGDQLLGGYTSAIYPPEALEKANYTYRGDAEAIIAANPDCVLIRPFISKKAPQLVKQLKLAGITVVSLYPDSFEQFDTYIQKLAMLVGKEEVANSMLKDFHKSIDDLRIMTSDIEDKQTVFFESTDKNVRTVAPDSMPAIAIKIAGGINIASDVEAMSKGGSIASFGVEKVISNANNIDVYISQVGAMNAGGNINTVSDRPGFNTIKAIKDKRFYTLSEKLISSPTFRYLKGVKEIARYLYPDILDDISSYENDDVCNNSEYASIIVAMNHLPLYTPTSSKYYSKAILGHKYGFFEDVKWDDENFDLIETSVYSGLQDFATDKDKEYFYPDNAVTREQLASTLYLMGEFNTMDKSRIINDLDSCKVPKIVQKLVDHQIMTLDDDNNFNPKSHVTNQEVIDAMRLVL